MLEQLQGLMSAFNTPTHPTVGEAYITSQNLAAYYFLRAKVAIYIPHIQSQPLKDWWTHAAEAVERRIDQFESEMKRLGIPLPPGLPQTVELTDQFMALDGMAMVKGMLMADVIGIQSTLQPSLIAMHNDMFQKAQAYGASLMGIMEKEGWAIMPPDYSAQGAQH